MLYGGFFLIIKLKALADDKLNVAKIMISSSDSVGNMLDVFKSLMYLGH